MWDIAFYLIVIAILGGLAAVAAYFGRHYLAGGTGSPGLFGAKAERRLDVVEQSSVDGRRRLVLIRRDDVEHLIMTGGPVDVVIETGIEPRRSRIPADRQIGDVAEAQPVFSRAPRSFGMAGSGGE
ncbi:MAG: flagellar biosynthetic protein FliO [Hyphomicrobiaceae bacterium]|nr:flagellar biosynthetic protein FliO [Hyphomicrobiaceae bacterium]